MADEQGTFRLSYLKLRSSCPRKAAGIGNLATILGAKMSKFRLIFGALFPLVMALPSVAAAQVANVPALPEPGSIPLYPGDKVGASGDENWTKVGSTTVIRNVTRPLLTPVLPPTGKATGAAVVIAPGGGMIFLAMPGQEIARALAEKGISVFVLKYRVVPTPREIPDLMVTFSDLQERSKHGEVVLPNPEGEADAQAAVSFVRTNAAKWGVDPRKVGLLGFSSGARISRAAALSDKPEGRPDFVGLIYGAMDAVNVPATAPPLFAAIAMDDNTVPSTGFPTVESWRRAKRPVELHAYQTGGHGFAQGGPSATHRLYLDQFTAWMTMQGFLAGPTTAAAK